MYEYRAKVEKVVDGDTMDLSIDLGFDIFYASRVRLLGIDTPESRTRDLEEKKRGLAAKDRVLELCPVGSSVILKTSKDGKGKFGRILGSIYPENEVNSVNDILVNEGHAVAYFGGKKS
jgi:micrococcal nuclease